MNDKKLRLGSTINKRFSGQVPGTVLTPSILKVPILEPVKHLVPYTDNNILKKC